MRYFVSTGEHEHVVTSQPADDDAGLRVRVEGILVAPGTTDPEPSEYAARVVPRPNGCLVIANGRVMEVHRLPPSGKAGEPQYSINGRLLRARVQSEQRRSLERLGKGKSRSAETTLRSPMAGRIVRVAIAQGASVRQGDTLIVIEAMKMQNELVAPSAGVVEGLEVRSGDLVEAGAVLLHIR